MEGLFYHDEKGNPRKMSFSYDLTKEDKTIDEVHPLPCTTPYSYISQSFLTTTARLKQRHSRSPSTLPARAPTVLHPCTLSPGLYFVSILDSGSHAVAR